MDGKSKGIVPSAKNVRYSHSVLIALNTRFCQEGLIPIRYKQSVPEESSESIRAILTTPTEIEDVMTNPTFPPIASVANPHLNFSEICEISRSANHSKEKEVGACPP